MSTTPVIKLNNGVEMPAIGLGGWSGTTPEQQATSQAWFSTALKSGYKHIDTAYNYHTEKYVGNAVRESGIPREELFITTKLPWHHYARVAESFQESLDALGLGYIDLYLIHWPQPILYDPNDPLPKNPDGTPKTTNYPFTKIWADMEKLLDTGKVRAIGVSNFSIKNLEILLESAKVVPAVNQVELHPYLAQPELVDYCKQKGIAITAYTPTGYQTVRDDPVIVELASKYRVSPAQVILAWHMSRGVIVTPKSANAERQRENINLPVLEPADLQRISALDKGLRLCNKPDEHGKVWGATMEELGW